MTLEEFITKHEGRKNKVYKCPAGKNTIGVGWNIDANPLPSDIAKYLAKNSEITDAMIDRLLMISIGAATLNCHALFPEFNTFTQNRRMALIDFLFNVGIGTAKRFVHAIAAINTGRWDDAAKEMKDSSWYRQVGNRADEVIELIENG